MKILSSAKGQPDPLQEGMKCLNKCYIMRYLIFGVLILWVLFLLLLGFLILLAVDYVSKWVEAIATRTNDSRVVMSFVTSNILSGSFHKAQEKKMMD